MTAAPTDPGRVGVWLIGGAGNVATATAVGHAAWASGQARTTGLVTALPEFAAVPLAGAADLVLGGCDLGDRTPAETAARLVAEGCLGGEHVAAAGSELANYGAALGQGVEAGPIDLAAVRAALEAFRDDSAAERLVVVNLASTEALVDASGWRSEADLEDAACRGELPPSAAYAAAALQVGAAYVNFTPSLGASMPAAAALCRDRGGVHAGRDGKTGETLLKSALLPLFAHRNLHVLSWFGQNILGNRDGMSLREPGRRSAKQGSKGSIVPAVLGYQPDAPVNIDYVESLGDWKIAWDHIHFEGFLGTRMSLQLTWQGADSMLAAPLVLDLVRLCDLALRRGERGALGELAFFFKDPIDCDEHALERQFDRLLHYARA